MHFATAVRRVRTVAQECDRVCSALPEHGALLAAYVFGPILDQPGADADVVHLALVMDMPVGELPWGVEPVRCSALAGLLGLDKAPVVRRWRPGQWPVWNHAIRRPMPIWTREGVQSAALDALAARRAEAFRLPDPDQAEQEAQFERERAQSLAHLRMVRERYWDDNDWRRSHRRGGRHPEEHLWAAVDGYLDVLDASSH